MARHAAGLAWDRIPQHVRHVTAQRLLDTVSAILAGLHSPDCQRLIDHYVALGGMSQSSIPGREQRVPAHHAAFLGGVLAHWYELDDHDDVLGLHPSAVIVPALAAVAEAAHCDEGRPEGREFVAAVVAAFDVAYGITDALRPIHGGWMPSGLGGMIGAAAGAARLLGLDAPGICAAMGLAAQTAGFSRQSAIDRVNGKNLLCGLAAGLATQAAWLARSGIEGPPHFLSGPAGLNTLIAGGVGDPERATRRLGQLFAMTEAAVKPYPCCRPTHVLIDMALDLLKEEPDLGRRVEEVEVTVPRAIHAVVGSPFQPGDEPRVAAQFSIPYTLALALKRGSVSLAHFDPERIRSDTEVLGLAERISVQPHDLPTTRECWWQGTIMKLRLDRAGVREVTAGPALRGSRERPLSPVEERSKLQDAAEGLLERDELDDLVAAATRVADLGIAAVLRRLRRVGSPREARLADADATSFGGRRRQVMEKGMGETR